MEPDANPRGQCTTLCAQSIVNCSFVYACPCLASLRWYTLALSKPWERHYPNIVFSRSIPALPAIQADAKFAMHTAIAVGRHRAAANGIGAVQQVAKAQDADPVGDALDAEQANKLPVKRGLEQGLFHGQVTQAEPLLDEVNAQHGLQ